MNAVEQLYRNSGLVTEDGYVKVNDNLWVKFGPYQEQEWKDTDKSVLPTKDELHEIYLKFQELILMQEACKLDSLNQILDSDFSWVWSSTEDCDDFLKIQKMSDGSCSGGRKNSYWVIPVRRTS